MKKPGSRTLARSCVCSDDILPDCRTEEMAIHAIYPSQRHLSAKARLFIDLLAEELQLRAGEGEGSSE